MCDAISEFEGVFDLMDVSRSWFFRRIQRQRFFRLIERF
jgi:hypothetical protein